MEIEFAIKMAKEHLGELQSSYVKSDPELVAYLLEEAKGHLLDCSPLDSFENDIRAIKCAKDLEAVIAEIETYLNGSD